MALVKYVGNQSPKLDRVANSGAVWSGNGDVQEVSDLIAARLVKFPASFELVSDKPKKDKKVKEQTDEEKAAEAAAAAEKAKDDAAKVTNADIEKMGKDELEAYARAKFNVELDKRHPLPVLLAEVLKLNDEGK
jgi:hypothetical protein